MALIRAEQISGSVYSSITSSYIDPLFISASAAAAGFTGMGGVTSVILSTQSTELQGFAPAGGIYFTSSSFFVGLD